MTTPCSCFHCGLPVLTGKQFQANILEQERTFCCTGCLAVAQTIVQSGLESYYQHRSDTAINPSDLPKVLTDELALYDRKDVQAPFVETEGDTSQAALMIEGISCAACGWLIERHMQRVTGVVEARLNLSSHRLQLRWNSKTVALSDLLQQIRHIGYAAHPYKADEAQERIAQENKRALRQLGMAGLLWMQVMMATMATWPEFNIDLSAGMDSILRWTALLLTTPIVFYCSIDFFKGAIRDLKTRHLTMDVSVSLAILGAYGAGIWSTVTGKGELYFDAVGMFALFLLAGRYLERRARERTIAATSQLVNLLPTSCLRINSNGHSERILLSELHVGDHVLIPPGALIPADGIIAEGHSSVDESVLTGEYLPLPREAGQAVIAGSLNVEGPLKIQVNALGDNTQLSAIVQLPERAQSENPRLAEIADRVAQFFLVIVLGSALLVGLAWWYIDSDRAFWVVLSLLVATCPCALSLATPTALTTATGSLHKLGLLLTRGHVLEGLNHIDTVIFDKTGTLTEGKLTLDRVIPLAELDADTCLSLAAALEKRSEHPIARAFGHTPKVAEEVISIPASGLEGRIDGQRLRIGQPAFVAEAYRQAAPIIPGDSGQWLMLGNEQGPLAWFVLDDRLRPDAAGLVNACHAKGWQTLLLSGDTSPMVQSVAETLGITQAFGGLTPDDKLQKLRELQAQGHRVMMLGDGVNDVPVLAGADISITMGSATDLAKTSADAVLLSNRLSSLTQAFQVAKRCHRIIIENLAWATLYNGLVLPFAAIGWVTPLWAALGMSVSSLFVVLNALRLARVPALPNER